MRDCPSSGLGESNYGAQYMPALVTRAPGASQARNRPLLRQGWRDLVRQIAIWLGFVFSFALVSSLAGRRPETALANGLHVIELERTVSHGLLEVTLQRAADSSWLLTHLTTWTYRNSEFTVLSLALLWVYLARNEAFLRFRNTIFVTNLAGLVVYFALPTAPPRMFPQLGFVDAVADVGGLDRDRGPLSNPYAAMPSLHAADALIVGAGLALLVRRRLLKVLWLLWPAWVAFCVVATANHFLLDVIAGFALALTCALALGVRARTRASEPRRSVLAPIVGRSAAADVVPERGSG